MSTYSALLTHVKPMVTRMLTAQAPYAYAHCSVLPPWQAYILGQAWNPFIWYLLFLRVFPRLHFQKIPSWNYICRLGTYSARLSRPRRRRAEGPLLARTNYHFLCHRIHTSSKCCTVKTKIRLLEHVNAVCHYLITACMKTCTIKDTMHPVRIPERGSSFRNLKHIYIYDNA